MCKSTAERPTQGLGIFDINAERFTGHLKVPHMGWNIIKDLKGPLFKKLPERMYMYFVHSYYIPSNAESIADSDYGMKFSAALKKDNFYGVQFHPEKSGEFGEKVLEHFINL
jgi:glutamine amidotransferase